MPAAPNVLNYHIGKGIVKFKVTGGGSFVDMGNAPKFIYSATVTKKEHFSSRSGIKTKDFTAITQVGATIKITLDEITAENLAIFALGTYTGTGGVGTITGLTNAQKTGTIQMAGTNDIGQLVSWTGDVSFVPAGDLNLISDSDDFSIIELEAEVQKAVDGSFGTFTVAAQT